MNSYQKLVLVGHYSSPYLIKWGVGFGAINIHHKYTEISEKKKMSLYFKHLRFAYLLLEIKLIRI